jgi:hypothetical protein
MFPARRHRHGGRIVTAGNRWAYVYLGLFALGAVLLVVGVL